jgi:hypothetical protein
MEEKEKGKISLRTNEAFISLKRDFINKISEINAIANTQGKGRDDLSIEIMLHAEQIQRKVSYAQSQAVRNMAEHIKMSLQTIRMLFKKYAENIEVVDP